MDIRENTLNDPQVRQLIAEHLRSIAPTAPKESRHALGITGLNDASISFWSLWDGDMLSGIGALKALSPQHGEVKSMRTAAAYVRRGVASSLLKHIIAVARARQYERLSLETGSMDFFAPARKLYQSFGFVYCDTFTEYKPDNNSVFMTLELR